LKTIVDAGPLIALINASDEHHPWAVEAISACAHPLFTCPEVLAEVAAVTGQLRAVVGLVRSGAVVLDFDLGDQAAAVLRLLEKYADQAMDLADACVVRMSEMSRDCRVLTTDRADFGVYRRNGREAIPIIAPPPVRR
jgi:uncharacterized protein